LSGQIENGLGPPGLHPLGESGLTGGYSVELPVFEGPLDLLLHLIRKHEIDIFDIPISTILEKYIAYMEWMRALNLDVAGEFLVMAATLAQIKSKMLLPPGEGEGEEEEQDEVDPREELVRRLLEYQRYKEAAAELRDRPILDRDVFARRAMPAVVESEDEASPFADVSVFRLIEALDKVMLKASKRIPHEILIERISIADRIQELTAVLAERRELIFEELFGDAPTRSFVVITFIALLEMTRLHMIRLHQADGGENLYVTSRLEHVDLEQALALVKDDEVTE